MTDPAPTPPPERLVPPPEPVKPATLKDVPAPPGTLRPAATHSPRRALPVFTAIGFLCLAAAVLYLWQARRDEPQVDPARIASLEGQTRDLRVRLATIDQRIALLEQRPMPAGAPSGPPDAGIDLRPLEARLAALESRAAPQSGLADLSSLEPRLAAAERLGRLQAAGLALDAGLPLGLIAQSPPALARFATVAPPTLSSLRAAFPEIARRARAASHPVAATWSDRLGQTLAGLVTIRRGNDVLIGPAASAVLATAQDRLDAADLPGAVAALDTLDPAAAAITAAWKADAQALLAARAALATLARP